MLTQTDVKALSVLAKSTSVEDIVENHFDDLFEYYTTTNLMPYGTAKARDGDPYQWIENQLTKEI